MRRPKYLYVVFRFYSESGKCTDNNGTLLKFRYDKKIFYNEYRYVFTKVLHEGYEMKNGFITLDKKTHTGHYAADSVDKYDFNLEVIYNPEVDSFIFRPNKRYDFYILKDAGDDDSSILLFFNLTSQ